MKRRPLLVLALLAAAVAPAAHAAESHECGAPLLALLNQQLHVAHFAPGLTAFGSDPEGVIVASACKPMPNDPRLTVAAVAWKGDKEDAKALLVAIADESARTITASFRDDIYEDAATQVNNGSLRLDTAAYVLAPGVRAFGLDIFSDDRSCGEGTLGPTRSLYVRDGKTLRPVVAGLHVSESRYLRGNQPRCVSDPREAETAIVEDYNVTIALGPAGKGGWRDLVMTASSRRSDHHPGREPLHVSVPYDGDAYPLVHFVKAFDRWRQ
jgi:hypothetical protein